MLGANIKLLREEARLTKEELAEKVNISVEELTNIEKGKIIPDNKLLKQMCVYLRISVEDILERDIVAERNDAERRMKSSSVRKDYNWYLGDRKKLAMYISYLIVIPVTFILALLLFSQTKEILVNELEMPVFQANIRIFMWSYLITCLPTFVYVLLFIIKKYSVTFRWWYLLILQFIFTIGMLLAAIALVPGIFYSMYQIFIKKGKN